MSMQILDIVIFSHQGEKRVLPLNPGKVNIITGSSKTGKSALVEIVNYCFGSSECEVPEGPIRRKVSWFGLRLKLAEGEAFIARRCPDPKAQSSEDCFVEVATNVVTPDFEVLRQTTNTTGLGSMLTAWAGIKENVHEPPEGQTRKELTATVRHGLALCFQPQDEIIRRKQLFHGADDNWVAQSLKDTLPYFLGAVDDEYVRKLKELRRLRETLRGFERQLSEILSLRGDGESKAANLLAQARNIGLTKSTAETWEEAVLALREVEQVPLSQVDVILPDGEEYESLSSTRNELLKEQKRLRAEVTAARLFERDEQGFSKEADEQRARLTSIGIFEDADPGHACPLCSQSLTPTNLPKTEQIQETLDDIASRLRIVNRTAPQIESAIAELETELLQVNEALRKNRSELESVQIANAKFQELRDDSSKKAMILGRVSLYMESVPDLPDTKALEDKAAGLREQCKVLKEELSDENVAERLNSILSIISKDLTSGAEVLKLEHSKYPLRLSIKKLTIIADTIDGPVPMARMGSGENWVGYHLIAHLVLHGWFCQQDCPVPRFLFLDQPSQIYFPPEKDPGGVFADAGEDDRESVERMFRYVFEIASQLGSGFQVIITEHADFDQPWYQDAVVERWRGGPKLVPEDWPRFDSLDGESEGE